ncbi:MAG: hypothetical protein HYX20_02370 [Candidatus Yanofskybacteria bacterium]|nr:hypothetical protein [Candidatus Yanofskybacteria bacterium]
MRLILLILWIDKQMLKFFNKIAKDFNWLTGLDNFFLAILMLGLSQLESFLHFLIFSGVKYFIIMPLILFTVFFKLTASYKKRLLVERHEGVKSAVLHIEMLMQRLWWLFLSLFVFFMYMYSNKTVLIFASHILMWAWACFISIDQPPFKKSQVWQKIKNWLKNPSSQSNELVPVPVSVPHK